MTRGRLGHALLVARTMRHLRPAQVVHRGRLRAQKAALARFPGIFAERLRRPLPDRPGWPQGFIPLDGRLGADCPGAEANAKGHFGFLNEERDLGDPPDWEQGAAAQLWRYHLHYFEWAWSFVDHPDHSWASTQLCRLWRSWRQGTTFGRWDAWSPYVASLRSWALCGIFGPLVAGTEDEADFLDDLALHAGFVRANLELDVGGNHLLKNLKALVGLGVFLDDEPLLLNAISRLRQQVQVQVLPDGGHFEWSPSYHCQVLGDLVDVRDLLAAAGRQPLEGLDEAVVSMQTWLGAMLMPDGDVPLFNDCTLVGRERIDLLCPAAAPPAPLTVLQPSGYVVVRPDERLHLVADVGPPCPPDLPAHAHADCLSFELSVDGQRVVVDSGTSTYEPGDRRAYERSTAAHNTVVVDGQDQTEVWGAFRAGRRATPFLERAEEHDGTVIVQGSHDGYENLPGRPRHRRTWTAGPRLLEILDEVTGTGTHEVIARLHLVPDVACQTVSEAEVRVGPTQMVFDGGEVACGTAEVASSFGRRESTQCLTVTVAGTLPRRIVTTITTPG